MDLLQLRYFCKVADLRNFTKAAAALHVAQPAVTRQVQLLEDELGIQLLTRHNRGAVPTEAGNRLRAGAEAIFALMAQVKVDVVSRGFAEPTTLDTTCGGYPIASAPADRPAHCFRRCWRCLNGIAERRN